ncbi:hypothetical protein ACFU9B_42220 [Streptomyces sp. NPDC057592]|uniref:hypothetical protein n=1 Tax=unclassified Streptomyces TaxID=2593676 RepID=UPI0036C61921
MPRYKFTAVGYATGQPYTPATATGHIVAETEADAHRMIHDEATDRGVEPISIVLERA